MTKTDLLKITSLTVLVTSMFVLGLILGLILNRTYQIGFCQGVWEGGKVVAEAVDKDVVFTN